MLNRILLNGVVERVDLEKRDVVLITDTPVKSKPVKVTVHFWKTAADGDNSAWAHRTEWRDIVTSGTSINVTGHMGNNGRVIAEAFANVPTSDDDDLDDNCVIA